MRRWIFTLTALAAFGLGTTAHAAQLIVKLVGADAGNAAQAKRAPNPAVFKALSAATGLALTPIRNTFSGATVVRLPGDANVALATLAQTPGVLWAEEDRLMFPLQVPAAPFAPNDPNFTAQWGLLNIRAPEAWSITRGSAGIIVAVLDTGVLAHRDLKNKLLPGYDFIELDPDGLPFRANDGNGRDADATDPGDWVESGDLARLIRYPAEGDFTGCSASSSSWHGTAVSSIIAAETNNGVDISGVDWFAKILPVRVLGKCGERTSDVADGVAWAAGLPVPGVPLNPNPAHVLNLSLGTGGPCPRAMNEAFARALQAGTTRAITVAAGNSANDFAAATPANCNNVISVAALGKQGELARYSNYGAVTIAAPGGNTTGIVTLSNTGSRQALTDSVRSGAGTSFAAPMVAGVASLMLSVNPQLSATQIITILARTARPFADATCNYLTCGAGALDGFEAVKLAQTTVGEGGGTLVRQAPAAATHFTDLWFAEGENGWGMNVTHHSASQQLFSLLYTYNAAGKPLWVTLPGGRWLTDQVFLAATFTTTGPSAAQPLFQTSVVRPKPAGSAKLAAPSGDTLELSYQSFSDAYVAKRLKRLPF